MMLATSFLLGAKPVHSVVGTSDAFYLSILKAGLRLIFVAWQQHFSDQIFYPIKQPRRAPLGFKGFISLMGTEFCCL